MGGSFLTIRRGFLLAITAGALLVGCGGEDDGTVSVETSDLSKKEFVERADAICEATRTQFTQKYTSAVRGSKPSKAAQEALGEEIVEDILVPTFQKDVDQISALGAPQGDEAKVSAFLTALQQRIDEISERHSILEKTITPFAKAEKLAEAYGLKGCAESFS
jgi:hypothetical protein